MLTLNLYNDNDYSALSTRLWGIALIIFFLIISTSCASDKGESTPLNQQNSQNISEDRMIPNLTSNISIDANDYWQSKPGASVVFVPDSAQVLQEYVVTHPLNNPTNIRAYFEFRHDGNGRWGGYIHIGYIDNGRLYEGVFSTDHPLGYTHNRISYRNWYRGLPQSEFNQWFTFEGKRVFHGFFQDPYGAIVVVFDGAIDQNDGQPLTILSGSIWFKNFAKVPAPQYQGQDGEQCWFLLPPSPYECGTFRSSSSSPVVTTSTLYPQVRDGYKRLGTFVGVNALRVFRQ